MSTTTILFCLIAALCVAQIITNVRISIKKLTEKNGDDWVKTFYDVRRLCMRVDRIVVEHSALDERIEGLKSAKGTLRQRCHNLETETTEMKETIDDILTRLISLETKRVPPDVATSLSSLQAAVINVRDKMNIDFVTLVEKIEQSRVQIKDTQTVVTDVYTDLESVKDVLDRQILRIDKLQPKPRSAPAKRGKKS